MRSTTNPPRTLTGLAREAAAAGVPDEVLTGCVPHLQYGSGKVHLDIACSHAPSEYGATKASLATIAEHIVCSRCNEHHPGKLKMIYSALRSLMEIAEQLKNPDDVGNRSAWLRLEAEIRYTVNSRSTPLPRPLIDWATALSHRARHELDTRHPAADLEGLHRHVAGQSIRLPDDDLRYFKTGSYSTHVALRDAHKALMAALVAGADDEAALHRAHAAANLSERHPGDAAGSVQSAPVALQDGDSPYEWLVANWRHLAAAELDEVASRSLSAFHAEVADSRAAGTHVVEITGAGTHFLTVKGSPLAALVRRGELAVDKGRILVVLPKLLYLGFERGQGQAKALCAGQPGDTAQVLRTALELANEMPLLDALTAARAIQAPAA